MTFYFNLCIYDVFIFLFFFSGGFISKFSAEAPVSVSDDVVSLVCFIKDSTYENVAVYLNFLAELIGNKIKTN